jgi:hypothetical protein
MTAPAAGGLRVERDAVALPGLLGGPVVGVAAAGCLHLFTGNTRADAQHMAVDAAGAVAIEAHSVGVPPVVDASALGGQILLVCAGEAGGTARPQLVLADTSGTPVHVVEVPLAGKLAHWPLVAEANGQAVVVWAETGAGDNALWGAGWAPGAAAVEPTRLAAAPETIAGLALAGDGRDAVVAVHGPSGGVALSRLRDGRVDATAALVPDSGVRVTRVYPRAGGWWVLVLDDSGAADGVHAVDEDLLPVGQRLMLPKQIGGERTRDAMVVVGGDRRTAIDVQFAVSVPGRVIATSGTRRTRAHAKQIREVVTMAETDSAITELGSPGIGYRAAAWLDDHLIVVHGEDVPLVTVLSVSSQ